MLKAIIILVVSFTIVNSARILAVFPVPSISHQVVFRPLTQELARRGHEVVVITPDPAFPPGQSPANLTEIDVHDLSYAAWQTFVSKNSGTKDDRYNQLRTAIHILPQIFETQVKTKEVQDLLRDKNKKFDLLFTEACVLSTLALSHIYKVPVIQVSSFGAMTYNYEAMGAPTHPILYPSVVRYRLYNLTIWEKITELYDHYKTEMLLKEQEIIEYISIKKIFGVDMPPIKELYNNIHMLFLNIHPIWEGNFPVPPGIVYMGGLHLKPEKELPKDMKSYLDSSKHGFIYMSFGTNTKSSMLPAAAVNTFIKVFSELPYDVLWKWDNDELPNKSKNIKIGKWFPQSDLLRHPKIKLFITQGGLQSTDEAITAGVPLLGIPMLGDQWYNVEKYVFYKIGVRLDMDNIDEHKFRDAINNVIGDTSYKKNIQHLGAVMRDQPMKPLERVMWWTEHVLRHGGARHLRAPAANVSWAEYLEIELVVVVFSIIILALSSITFILYLLSKYFTSSVKLKVL